MGDVTTLKGLWASPEWKARSRAYVQGKACEWCGARAGDRYTDSAGRKRTVGLAPHHVEKHKWGLPLWRQVRDRLYARWLKDHDPGEAPRGLSARETKRYHKDRWTRGHLELINVAFEEEKRRIIKDYLELSPEKIIVLCGRCHYAREKGLLICPECKTRHRIKGEIKVDEEDPRQYDEVDLVIVAARSQPTPESYRSIAERVGRAHSVIRERAARLRRLPHLTEALK